MKKSSIIGALFAGAIGIAASAIPALAMPISTNTWYVFGFGDTGSALGASLAFGAYS